MTFQFPQLIGQSIIYPQHDLAVPPIDRAVNNISFISKKIYTTTLFKEFGVIGTHSKI